MFLVGRKEIIEYKGLDNIPSVAQVSEPTLENIATVTELLNLSMGWPESSASIVTKVEYGLTYSITANVHQTGGDYRGLIVKSGSVKSNPNGLGTNKWYWEISSISSAYGIHFETESGGFYGDLTNIVVNVVD